MRRDVAWLHAELPDLVARGILTPEVADALRRHYGPPEDHGTPGHWAQLVLAAAGALLVGGGIILILAHNWDALGRPARAAIALTTLLVAQALTVFAIVGRPGSRPWLESTSAFLVAAVGAALALVGQTYHVGGSFEGLMRAWLWLVVPLPYLTGSSLASVGFWALLVVRLTGGPVGPDVWPVALAALPYVAWRVMREPASWATALVTAAAAIGLFVLGSVVAFGSGWHGSWAIFQVSFLAALIAAAVVPWRPTDADAWGRRVFVPAWVALVVVATVLTFEDPWRGAGTLSETRIVRFDVAITAAVVLASAGYASMVAFAMARKDRLAAAVTLLAPLVIVLSHGAAAAGAEGIGWLGFNLWLLAVGALTVGEGVRALNLGTANRGLLALAVLAVARFFDTDLSFLVRGLAFVGLGVACFGLNVWLMRRVRRGPR